MALPGVIFQGSATFYVCAAAFLFAIYFVQTALKAGLRSVPGPFLAKFTDLWRFRKVLAGNYEQTTLRLHERYGDVVRVGPRTVCIADPSAIESIYGLKANFPKSKFYNAFMQMNNGKRVETFFTTQNIAWHSAIKRPVSSAYSMTTITDYEPHVDVIMERLLHRLESEYCSKWGGERVCDLGKWLHYCNSLGFLEAGEDVNAMIRTMERDMDYFAPVTQMPWVDYFWRKNPFSRYVIKKSSRSAQFGLDKIRERRSKSTLSPREQTDFLSKFLKATKTHPQVVDDDVVVSYMVGNLVAGSDTTAISLRAVLYFLLKHPVALKRLREEIDQAGLPEGPVSWENSQKLPYLAACIKETFRMHPAVGLPLERVAPSEYTLPNGIHVPAGTILAISAWPIHRNISVFGERANEYIPERWLQQPNEDEHTFEERMKRMKRADMTFGYGTRTCMGKNIGLLETYKTIPTLLKTFDITLANPQAEWKLHNAWFVRQWGFEVYLTKRRG